MIFGLIAATLLILAALLRFLAGIVFAVSGRGFLALGSLDGAVILLVLGLLIGFFAILGRSREADRSIAAGVLLVVLAVVGWLALGFGNSLLAILGAVFTLISGILFLVVGR